MAITRFSGSNITTGNKKFASFDTGYPTIMATPTATDGGTGTTVSVAFTAQTGATSYTVLSSPGSFTGSGTSSPITVSGLTAGTAYTFQVRAINSVGAGPYSAASNSVTPVVPSAYDSLATATGVGTTSVTFSSIPSSTYAWLELRYSLLQGDNLSIRFNGASSNAYYNINSSSQGTSSVPNFGQRQEFLVEWGPSGGSTTRPTVGVIRIGDYRNGTRYKSAIGTAAEYLSDTSTSNGFSGAYYGASVASISSLTVFWTNNALSGTSFALYGIKGTVA